MTGILAVYAVGRLNFTSGFAQKGFYDKVMGSLEYARKSGVAQRRYVCARTAGNNITFTINSLAPENGGAVNCPVSPSGTEQALAMATPDSKCGGATNEVCAPSGGAITLSTSASPLTFDATGSNTGATVTFTATGQPIITVEAVTGYVH